jgi:hypothetical protein
MRKGLPDPTPAGRDTIVTKGWLRRSRAGATIDCYPRCLSSSEKQRHFGIRRRTTDVTGLPSPHVEECIHGSIR